MCFAIFCQSVQFAICWSLLGKGVSEGRVPARGHVIILKSVPKISLGFDHRSFKQFVLFYITNTSPASSSESNLQTLAFTYIWWVILPNCWVCNSILYAVLLLSLSCSLLHCLDQLICLYFPCFDFSLIASAVADFYPANCIFAQHPNWFVDSFVCLYFCLHICMLYFYCLVPFISVLLLSLRLGAHWQLKSCGDKNLL